MIALHEGDSDIVVQSGITWQGVNEYLDEANLKHPLFFPLDPGPSVSGVSGERRCPYSPGAGDLGPLMTGYRRRLGLNGWFWYSERFLVSASWFGTPADRHGRRTQCAMAQVSHLNRVRRRCTHQPMTETLNATARAEWILNLVSMYSSFEDGVALT